MTRTRTARADGIRMAAWLVLAVLILSLAGSLLHMSCCHHQGVAGEMCPVCAAILRYYRLLRGAGLAASFFVLPCALNGAGRKSYICSSGWLVRATPVRLGVKLLD